jgi:hypothetical protein
MLLLLIVVAPILGMLSVFVLRLPPWPMGISIFLLGGGGILRIAYALMFESNVRRSASLDDKAGDPNEGGKKLGESPAAGSLPAQREEPASAYTAPRTGQWLDTNELEPASVTENTTKLLEKDQ